ncbi:GNAT family N-acetyltransferase [Bacillus carboniphilus]|uniref:GNAT family N-acetyltransferase n=1 Tax=Bacillus carboniphilus TaxID=86663 RepID=A0ABY9JVH4_9BACI|nr:GNAT family N-acetyltransferase [Bacillus carboniphilus]WLR42420.1 GNAT family N-acetyltransferase [Bacillus carboniphilus]
MHWYDKLNQYFPIEEMKSKEHIELLLDEKSDIYYKDEGPEHVLLYAELDEFVFIDYIYVAKEARGKGLGYKLLKKLKDKQKPIILEVEPVDYQDSDTEKRLHFYAREGFEHATSIGYNRKSLATNETNSLEILYWSPTNESKKSILNRMKQTYEKIHTYKDKHLYGEAYQPVDQVLKIEEGKEDILKPISVK